ncbi:hypothetical protein [Runella sp.]|uniref:hypothetical protein n=1 Tax=Runella sp. TaxID=1960881 RepID=UPI002623EE6C|nr:hypothetical protein [Runella sp.]
MEGLSLFCHQYSFDFEVIRGLSEEVIQDGEVYISITENDLITLVEKVLAS